MTKGELRTIIREVLQEELSKTTLKEEVAGPTYVIKAWDTAEKNTGVKVDTSKTGKTYPDFDDVVAALQKDYSGYGAYEITWLRAGEKSKD
jgi:hypothetical protein